MTTPELQRARQAIAEVRERYGVFRVSGQLGYGVRRPAGDGELSFVGRNRAEYQAWIDLQAARACFESVLPVGEGVITTICVDVYGMGCLGDPGTRHEVSRIVTDAIRHITTGGDDAV